MKRIPNRRAAFLFMERWLESFRQRIATGEPLTPDEVEDRLKTFADHVSPFNRCQALGGGVRRRPPREVRGAAARLAEVNAFNANAVGRFIRDLPAHGVTFMVARERFTADINSLCLYASSGRMTVSGVPGDVVVTMLG